MSEFNQTGTLMLRHSGSAYSHRAASITKNTIPRSMGGKSKYLVLLGMLNFSMLFASLGANAQEVFSNYDERFERSRKVVAEDVDSAFGARISPATGSLSFSVPVLSIPGNPGPSIDVNFKLQLRSIAQTTQWIFEEDKPHLHGSFSASKGWVTYSGSNARCSSANVIGWSPPLVPSSNGRPGNFYPYEYWYGYFLSLPSGGGRLNRFLSGSKPSAPINGDTYYWSTNDYWYFSCMPLASGGTGEGFVGHAPDGTEYYFDTMGTGPWLPNLNKNHTTGYELDLERQEVRIYAGKIEDRFGNYIAGLTGSDGRVVTRSVSGTKITYAFDGRQWVVETANPFKVTYPDGSTWTANVSGTLYTTTTLKSNCPGNPNYVISPQAAVASVKSTSGATAVYTVKQKLFGYSYVSGQCVDPSDGGGTENPSLMVLPALVSRSVSGPGLQTSVLSISYGPTNECFTNALYWTPKCTGSSPVTRTVKYTYSDGRYKTYTFGNRYWVNADLLLKLEEGATGGAPMKTTEYQYSLLGGVGTIAGNYPYGAGEYKRSILVSKKIHQDGRIYNWSVATTCGGGSSLCLDQYGRPTKIIKSSSP